MTDSICTATVKLRLNDTNQPDFFPGFPQITLLMDRAEISGIYERDEESDAEPTIMEQKE